MSSIMQSLYIGASALAAQQKALQVTSHNIANVNTPGYSRQRVNFESLTWQTRPCMLQEGIAGVGVRATDVERIFDRFLGDRINLEASETGQWEARQKALDQVEALFNEGAGTGLSQALCEFWDAWGDVSNNPEGLTERNILLVKSQNLVDVFNQLDRDLVKFEKQAETNIEFAAAEINSRAAEIAALNKQIVVTEATGQSANDFRDQRDVLLKELSTLVGFDTTHHVNGSLSLSVGGLTLIDNFEALEMTVDFNVPPTVVIEIDGVAIADNANIAGGKLKGWIDVRDEILPEYSGKLDGLANALVIEVNNQHVQGFDLDGNTNIDFFLGSDAAGIALDINHARQIAAAGSLAGVPGDPSNAIAMAQLRDKKVNTPPLSNQTLEGFYNDLVSGIGIDARNAERKLAHHTSAAHQLDNYRESVSGVHLDEEMTNLIKYQYAYTAAAKLIGTVDEMMQTILALK